MATLSSNVIDNGTSWVNSTSEISIKQVESFFDFQNFLLGDIGRNVLGWIEAHLSC